MTVAELRRRLSTSEFAQWVAFYNVEAAERDEAAKKRRKRG